MMLRYYLVAIVVTAGTLLGCRQSCQEVCDDLPEFVDTNSQGLVITRGKLQMEILPSVAGRISSVEYDNREILIPTDYDIYKPWGTALWSSPQSEWAWPPIEILDSKPYTLSIKAQQLVLTSEIDKKTGYQFVKTYSLGEGESIRVDYRIYNHSQRTKNVAAMEVTRFSPEGEIFFPKGDTPPRNGIFYPLIVHQKNNLIWYSYDRKKIREDHHKIMMDAKEGWVAYRKQGCLLIKKYQDLPPAAIVEGEEVEIFAHVDHSFLELKIQGAAASLAPGEYLDWTVNWSAKKLPESLAQENNVTLLANYVRTTLNP